LENAKTVRKCQDGCNSTVRTRADFVAMFYFDPFAYSDMIASALQYFGLWWRPDHKMQRNLKLFEVLLRSCDT
jgi:hypothetical protein